jgi:hypothetical protein
MSKAHPAPTIPPSAPEPDFGQEKCGLFSDIAVKFEQGWVLGTVERMMRYYGKCRTKGVEYKFPVNLEDRKVNVLQFFILRLIMCGNRPPNVVLYCTWYRQKGRSKLKFTNEAADIKPVELKSVSTVVKLSYDPNTNTFTLAQEDREVRDHVYNGG